MRRARTARDEESVLRVRVPMCVSVDNGTCIIVSGFVLVYSYFLRRDVGIPLGMGGVFGGLALRAFAFWFLLILGSTKCNAPPFNFHFTCFSLISLL